MKLLKSSSIVSILLSLSLLSFGTVRAQQKPNESKEKDEGGKILDMNKLPAAVQRTVREQTKGATIRGLAKEVENGKTQYELETKVNGHNRDLLIDPAGKVLELVCLAMLGGAIGSSAEIQEHRPIRDQTAGQITRITPADGPRYARSVRAPDGAIYILGPLKTIDGGKSLVASEESDPPWGTALRESAMNSLLVRDNEFLAIRNKVTCATGGDCVGKLWHSEDGCRTIREGDTHVLIPEAGKVDNGGPGEWAGLFFHRSILEMPGGSLLAAMYGNFEQDTITPTNPRSKSETKYKLRAFVVRSVDNGKTWRYLATIATPQAGVVDDTEGFNEWSMVKLEDGRLLAVIRTGHYTPMVASWSSDEGKTWSPPSMPRGLGPGADPHLLKLRDGRLALAYGEIVQPSGPKEQYWKDYATKGDHRRRCRLAICPDGMGQNWTASTVADYAPRSAYSTIFEVEPNVLVYQADLEVWRIELARRK